MFTEWKIRILRLLREEGRLGVVVPLSRHVLEPPAASLRYTLQNHLQRFIQGILKKKHTTTLSGFNPYRSIETFFE